MMPFWLQVFAYINPLSYGIDALRALLLTGNLNELWLDFLILIISLLALSLISGKILKNIME